MNTTFPDRCAGAVPVAGLSRRDFLNRFGFGLGGLALAHLLQPPGWTGTADGGPVERLAAGLPHFAPKARRIIYLFMAGGPSQLETLDHKPLLNERNGEELPDSVRQGQRLTGMSGNQSTLPLAGSVYPFRRHGANGTWISDLLPHTAGIVDDLCIVRSLYTEAINHDPAVTFLQTGFQLSGRPSMGAWLSYGLGSENENLPAFVVLITPGKVDQPLYARLWGSGFLPSQHQGVQFRGGHDPVLYLNDPAGLPPGSRRLMLDRLRELHEFQISQSAAPELEARIARYEMAFRMQALVPEAVGISGGPGSVLDLYGPDVRKPGTFARHCLLARRLAERGVRFIQLYHQGWDQHGSKLTRDDYGRDHHPRCFSIWLAGGGIRPGLVFGGTCEFGYNVVRDPVHVHDSHATLLHLLGIDHERLTCRFQGRRFRLTDVHGCVVHPLLA